MECPRVSATPSINIYRPSCEYEYRFASESAMHGRSLFSSCGPMPIPTTKTPMHFVPPPLPPPTQISGLEIGHDVAWLHANSTASSNHKLAPINPNSSLLLGAHRQPQLVPQADPMVLDDWDGRPNGARRSRSPEPQIKMKPPLPFGNRYHNNLGVKLSESMLAGEQNFSRRSVKESRDAYDQHLLSRIGRPPSPGLGSDNHRSLTAPSLPSRPHIRMPSPSASEWQRGFVDLKWYNSPQSGAVSPRTKANGGEYLDCRSPSVESSAPSSTLEYDHISVVQNLSNQRGRKNSQYDDCPSLLSRSNRGSYDQGVFSDLEGDLACEEAGTTRIPMWEALPPYLDAFKPGMKRRASSPVREVMSSGRPTLQPRASVGDLSHQRREPSHPLGRNAHFGTSLTPSHGFMSSASSASLRTDSYSSPGGFSVGGSSTTSLSSYDRSPGGLSSQSDFDSFSEKSTVLKVASEQLLTNQLASANSQPRSVNSKFTTVVGKMPVQAGVSAAKATGSKLGGLYICDCCPKKPKKFDSADELRAHEMEKQYTCQFCSNRFKNKNEAERHQNSLHLRRHSWSCAALRGFQAAFHASGTVTAQTSNGPSHDTCGYCGDEFPNFPQPDWDQRFDHVTNVHKFGECNHSKKFYRADHFRQHLKHSHAGTSGKWTNILESACMREESPAELRLESIGERRVGATATSIGGDVTGLIAEKSHKSNG